LQLFQAAGIEIYTEVKGTAAQAVKQYLSGKLKPAEKANCPGEMGKR